MQPLAPLQPPLLGEAALLAREHPVALFPVVLDVLCGLIVHVPLLSRRHNHTLQLAISRTKTKHLCFPMVLGVPPLVQEQSARSQIVRRGLTSKICRWLLPDGPRTLFHGSKVSFTPGPVQ